TAQLLARMLSKDPAQRPRDGAHLARLLAREGAPGSPRRVATLTGEEKRLLCLIFLRPPREEAPPPALPREEHRPSLLAELPTLPPPREESDPGALPTLLAREGETPDPLSEIARAHEGLLERLANGARLVIFRGEARAGLAASDQARGAAR